MIVRRAATDDAAAIERVARATWRADYPEVLNRENAAEAAGDWYDEHSLKATIERENALVLVASLGDEVVGFAHAYVGADRGDLLRLYVAPGYRDRGVGTALVDRMVDDLFDEGVEAVQAMVLAANDQGRAFYEARGFELVSEDAETLIDGELYPECAYRLERED
ncbi:GNAT family N-acetyltransferase [Haloglomus litoreum]|uniref:GNAT family N-acetyltransferase n=1 Tax=Haloglomus litoreum TaxID=3034026 RepID=UPI0023E7E8D6|nr:GNAT family N-acetyltransferase [Haloglomus sp. DT116]